MSKPSEKAKDRPDSVPHGLVSARRVAGGTLVKAVGEVLAKVASVALYVVIARELGDVTFGNYVFALSLGSLLFTISAFGADTLVVREVARDDSRAGHLLGDVMSLKLLSGLALLLVMAAIVVVEGYSAEVAAAILVIGLGVGLETVTKTIYAIFQARMQMHYEAVSMVVERVLVSVLGIGVVLLGGNLVEVAAVFAAGSVIGFATALFWLYRASWPGWSARPSRWPSVVRAGIPIGLLILLYATLSRIDIALLSFLRGGDNTEVGHYGAAYRLIEATLFISAALGAAVFPWLLRQERKPDGSAAVARGYELSLKVLIAILMPVALILGLYAGPLIHLLYGGEYGDAVLPLQLLAAMTVLYGLNSMAVRVFVTRERPWEFAKPGIAVIVQNIAFNFILIPPYGAVGAAINAVISGLLLVILTLPRAERIFGPISTVRIWTPTVAASVAMAAFAVATLGAPWVPCAILAALVYGAVFLATERILFPGDFVYYAGVIGPLWRRLSSSRI